MSEEALERIMLEVPDFDGFGEQTYYDAECNSQYESEVEYRAEQEKEDHPQHLRLTRDQISGMLYDCVDWWKDEAKAIWAEAWAQSWVEAVEEETGIALGMKFQCAGNDVVQIEVSGEAVRAFWVMSMLDRHETFFDLANLPVGRDEPPATYEALDKEDTGRLFQAVLEKRGLWRDIVDRTKEGVWYDSDLGCHIWQEILDWGKFKAKMDEARQELVPEEEREPITERCPNTLDMFPLAMAA
jgi:hypothetical protein